MPLYDAEILMALYKRARQAEYQDKIAVQQIGGMRLTYSEFVEQIETVAKNLLSNGFQSGDRALLLIRPSVYTMVIVLAIVRVGGTVIVGDLGLGKDVFESRMRFAQPKWVFAESIILLLQKWDWVRRIAKQRGLEIPEISNMGSVKVVNVGSIPLLGDLSIQTLQKPVKEPATITKDKTDRDLMIVFTSGTTGVPKGVVHTLHSTQATLQRISEYLQLNDKDVFYTYALHLAIPVLIAGGTAILPPKSITVEKTLKAYRDYSITKTFDVPANIQSMLQLLRTQNKLLPSTLKTIMLGAAPVFTDFLEQLRPYLAEETQVWSIYGMTEMLPVCAVSLQDKTQFNASQGDLVGKPLSGIQVHIADDGELIIQGKGLYNRYLGQDTVTEHATGDIATIINEQVVLLGRKKDMIIRGNYNIYPLLFEPTIRDIEGVDDCALIGVYNSEKADEDIILIVEGQISEGDLMQALIIGDHSIDVYAHPDYILHLPVLRSGRSQKIDRKAMREAVREKLGIDDTRAVLEQSL